MTIAGTANGRASTPLRIDFFSNPTATSQGKVYLGSAFPTTDGGGVATISSNINRDPSMLFITATTSPNGTNTSPFSAAVRITGFPAPAIRTVSPNQGSGGGGTLVTISGANFFAGATVTFGGTPSPSVTVAPDGSNITTVAPPHAGGPVNVVVTNPDGQSATAPNAFTYLGLVPNPQPNGPPGGSPGLRPPAEPPGPINPSKPNPLPAVQR